MLSHTHRILSALLCSTLAVVAAACGAPQVQVAPAPAGPGPAYQTRCQAAIAQRAADVAQRRYMPVDLVIHQWPARPTAEGTRAWLSEVDLAAALTQEVDTARPHVHTALVLARGGTGKSRLAESLVAQTCDKTTVFRVDLNTEVVAQLDKVPAGVNAIAVLVAAQLGHRDPQTAERAVQAALGDKSWTVLLDALDETPLLQREQLAKQIDDLVQRVGPRVRAVVMTRPPVFTSNYGIQSVDARLEIPQLTCEETEAALARSATETAEQENIRGFLGRYGLNRKVQQFERCYYPHLTTYRDLQVVQLLARNAAVGKNQPDFKDFQSSRAQVYSYFATAQLLRDMQGVAISPAEAMRVVDAMVLAKDPSKGMRNFQFRMEDCVAASTIADPAAKQPACERLLQSSLFKPGPEVGAFHFDNQSVGDLFLARWAAQMLTNGTDKADCKRIDTLAPLLESNEIAGFLVGQPAGQKCVVELARALCKRGGYAHHITEQFDQGLPAGPSRATLVAGALDELKDMPKPDLCVSGLFDGLAKTVEMPKDAQEPAPADARKPQKADKTDKDKKAKKSK